MYRLSCPVLVHLALMWSHGGFVGFMAHGAPENKSGLRKICNVYFFVVKEHVKHIEYFTYV